MVVDITKIRLRAVVYLAVILDAVPRQNSARLVINKLRWAFAPRSVVEKSHAQHHPALFGHACPSG